MHEISVLIMQILALNDNAQHKNLKPEHLSGNEFNYHLKRLVRDGFIKQDDDRYSLSPKGLRHVQQSNFASMQKREQSTQYSCIFITDKNDHHFVQQRSKIPFKDLYCPIMGKIHHGETLSDAVERELVEKTEHAHKTLLSHISRIIIRNKNGYLLTDITLHVHHTQSDGSLDNFESSQDIESKKLFTDQYPINTQKEFYKEYEYIID